MSIIVVLIAMLAVALGTGMPTADGADAAPIQNQVSDLPVHTVPPGVTSVEYNGGATASIANIDGSITITEPVIAGTTPSLFSGAVVVPDGFTGQLVVTTPSREAAALPVAAMARRPSGAHVALLEVPLTTADTTLDAANQAVVSVTITADFDYLGGICPPLVKSPVTSLYNAALEFSGAAIMPATVAAFVVAPTSSIDVYTDHDASVQAAAAAISAGAALVTRAPNAQVSFAQGEPEGTSDVLARQLYVHESDRAGVALHDGHNGQYLELSGNIEQLNKAIAALAAPQVPLATAPALIATQDKAPALGATTLSFADLGVTGDITGVGSNQILVAVPQATFGQSVDQITVNVKGIHSATTPGEQATVSLLWNGQLIRSTDISSGASDSINLNATVTRERIQRDNTLSIRSEVTPVGGLCQRQAHPFQLSVSPSSTVTGQAGQALAAGFERFPQVLNGKLAVAFATNGLADFQNAGAIVTSLQRLSPAALVVTATSVQDAESSSSPVVVVGADSSVASSLGAPLALGEHRAITTDQRDVTYSLNQGFGALEAFYANGRDVIMLGHYQDDNLESRLVNQTIAGPLGWFALKGSVYITTAHTDTVAVPLDQVASPVTTTESTGVPSWVWAAIGAVILALLAMGVWHMVGRRRRIAIVRARNGSTDYIPKHLDTQEDDQPITTSDDYQPRRTTGP